jgi:hypothetical protein
MVDNPARIQTPAQFAARAGSWGTIPVLILKDHGDALEVRYHTVAIGGAITVRFWVARLDFMPSPPLAP